MIRIVIVDDDPFVSLSLKTILEAGGDIRVLDIGNSGETAIGLYSAHTPDVLLMDIRMNGLSGLDAASEILRRHPDARILLLTTFSDDEYIIKAIRIGAKGYILKQSFETIAPAIAAVHNGQTVFGEEIINRIPGLLSSGHTSQNYQQYDLTEKEFEIVRLVADGLNNKEIASELFLSEGTVRNYLSTILDKLELRDRTQLAVFYYRQLA